MASLLIMFLSVWSYATFGRSLQEVRAADRWSDVHHSFHLAESAIDTAIDRIEVGQFSGYAPMPLSDGTYWAEVQPMPDPRQFFIIGHGQVGDAQREIEVLAEISPISVFQFAIFGDVQVSVEGTPLVDSYNSGYANYDPSNPGENGDVGTNSVSPGGIVISGDGEVRGQMAVGEGVENAEQVVIEHGTAFTVTSSPPFTTQSANLGMPTVSLPAGLVCDDLSLGSHDDHVLSQGEHCIHNLSMTGGSTLTSTGPVTVYVTGNIELGGQGQSGNSPLVGDPDDATQMLFLLAAPGGVTQTVQLRGGSRFGGALYGPTAVVDIRGNAEVFGSMIAHRVELGGNASIHYDEALGQLTDPIAYYQASIEYWREQP